MVLPVSTTDILIPAKYVCRRVPMGRDFLLLLLVGSFPPEGDGQSAVIRVSPSLSLIVGRKEGGRIRQYRTIFLIILSNR